MAWIRVTISGPLDSVWQWSQKPIDTYKECIILFNTQVQSLYHYILHLFYLSRQIAFLPFIFTVRMYPLFSLWEPSYISSPLPVDKNIKRDNQGIILLFSSKYKRRCINVIFQQYKHNIYAVFWNINVMCIRRKTEEWLSEPHLYPSF